MAASRAARWLVTVPLLALALSLVVPILAQPAAPAEPQAAAAQAGEHGEPAAAGGHEEGWVWPLAARLINFAVLAGTLVYFLRKPFADYLKNRGEQIRRDLMDAQELRRTAEAQLAALDAKLKALPGEIEALRRQGAEEIAAEGARIRAAAAAERDRLLEQARREIDVQVRIAKQELRREAAELAVGVAAERIKQGLTPETHLRLVDRYADQVKETRTFHD
jgi:F-type H+-transporting ATPase subunit b